MKPLKPRRPDKRATRHPAMGFSYSFGGGVPFTRRGGAISPRHHCRMAATPYPAYQNEPTATPVWLLSAVSQRGVVSPLKSANRSVNDKVWTPWMADRGEPRQGASPGTGEQVESSRPPSGAREVSAVRSIDFLAGPRGLTRGARPLPLSRSPHRCLNQPPDAW